MKSILPWERNIKTIRDFRISLPLDCGNWESFVFKKYFPKFLRRFSLISVDHAAITKIKSLKRISHFDVLNLEYPCSKLKQVLGNKAQGVKSLQNCFQSQKLFAEKVKLFPRIESIIIRRPNTVGPKSQKIKEQYLIHACKMMRYLRNLKTLKIKQLSRDQKKFIEKLNSSPRLLKSLSQLEIHCNSDEDCGYSSSPQAELVKTLQRNKALLKYITKLDLGILGSNSNYSSFAGFVDACPRLLNLSLAFHCREISFHCLRGTRLVRDPFQVKVNYLKTVETFQNLLSLNLHISDILTFLKDFSAPCSLKHIELGFEEQFSKEIMLKIDNDYNEAKVQKIFEENEIVRKFYGKFQQLKNLNSLKLLFSDNSDFEAYRCQSYFVQSFMKKISSLKELVVKPLCYLSRLLKTGSGLKEVHDPYLPQFFGSCEGLGQALQTLKIGNENTVYSQMNLSASHGRFPKLSTVQITHRFKENSSEDNDLSELLNQIIPLGDALTMIRFYAFLIENTVEFLLSFLRQIGNIEKPDKLRIELYIGFSDTTGLEDLGALFENVMRKLKNFKKVKGFSIKLETGVVSEGMRRFLEACGEKFESFESWAFYPSRLRNPGAEDNF